MLNTQSEFTANALLNCGCEGSCIDAKFVKERNLNTIPLPHPIPVYNADGQPNSEGPIQEVVILEIQIKGHIERLELGVTNLGNGQIFLRHDWLKVHNPLIDWKEGIVEFD
jgi:hypothetical protein